MLSPKALVAALKEFLPNITVREILVAREGIKVARTGLRRPTAERLKALASSNGFYVLIGSQEGFPRRDRGKGGWCNSAYDNGRAGRGFLNVYVACSQKLSQQAHDAEACDDDLAFGSALGTPACCRQFYESVKDQAVQ